MQFFEAALKESRASVTPEMEREYEELRSELKREGPARAADRLPRSGAHRHALTAPGAGAGGRRAPSPCFRASYLVGGSRLPGACERFVERSLLSPGPKRRG
jgi:hypothetical protein